MRIILDDPEHEIIARLLKNDQPFFSRKGWAWGSDAKPMSIDALDKLVKVGWVERRDTGTSYNNYKYFVTGEYS